MTPWTQRSQEERGLLNPCFCANLLWHSAKGHAASGTALSIEESFLVLPIVLHREIREGLPRSTRTSLAVWLSDTPLARGKITRRTQLLVPFTKEALLFGGIYGFLRIDRDGLHADDKWKKSVNQVLNESSNEVRDCAKMAEFAGKWFAQSGSAVTVLALMGVRP